MRAQPNWRRFAASTAVVWIMCSALTVPAQTADSRSPGTLEMVGRLRELDANMDVMSNIYESAHRAARLEQMVGVETDPARKFELMWQHAIELLNTGESEAAIQGFKGLVRAETELTGKMDPVNLRTIQVLMATAWMRLGEQENCITNHTIESCLLPIQGGGIHVLKRGSTEALKILNDVVARDPYRLDSRWLLNVAHMTLGDYPQNVPPAWLVPPARFESEYDIGRFRDVAGDVGFEGNNLAGGVVVDDFNNDGLLDVMLSDWGSKETLNLYLNNGDGSFTESAEKAGLAGLTGGLNMIQADYNNDGFVDVLVLRGAWLGHAGRIPNSLLRNNGDGTFSDVTMEAGLGVARPTQTAVWFDYDGDGWIDLFVGNETFGNERHRCELFHNLGNGTFKECSFESGLALFEFVKGVASADYNHDGRPDLFISIMGAPNRLYRNDGPADPSNPKSPWKFTDVSAAAHIGPPLNSFPCWFFDYDNDGWDDLFVASYNLLDFEDAVAEIVGMPVHGDTMHLYHNRGDGTFEDTTKAMHLNHSVLAMGCNFGDLDNDGWLDFYLGTGNPDLRAIVPNKMFRNASGEFFQDVTTSGGFGHLQKGHAIAFADLDNDGDQDVFAHMGGAYSGDVYRNALFQNPGHGNHWLKLKLEGVRSNRSAIGARIKVEVRTPAGERSIFKTVNSGGSFGANPLRQEIGVGDATAIERVEIFWPATGRTQVLKGIELDHAYFVREDAASAVVLNLKPTPFKLTARPAHHSR
jgi:hypothetical protein